MFKASDILVRLVPRGKAVTDVQVSLTVTRTGHVDGDSLAGVLNGGRYLRALVDSLRYDLVQTLFSDVQCGAKVAYQALQDHCLRLQGPEAYDALRKHLDPLIHYGKELLDGSPTMADLNPTVERGISLVAELESFLMYIQNTRTTIIPDDEDPENPITPFADEAAIEAAIKVVKKRAPKI